MNERTYFHDCIFFAVFEYENTKYDAIKYVNSAGLKSKSAFYDWIEEQRQEFALQSNSQTEEIVLINCNCIKIV